MNVADTSLILGLERVVLVGTGLLGGSIGLGLRTAGFKGRIIGVGRRTQTVERARALGCVDEISTDVAAASKGRSLTILATPLSGFAAVFQGLSAADHDGLTITDVGSTKGQVCADAKRILKRPNRFVGSHPMAGAELHGPDAARADLFQGKPCVITPDTGADPDAIRLVESLWQTLGMRLVRLSPEAHDHKVAAISHLPHATAAILIQLAAEAAAIDVASTGFRDTTRVASGDPSVWIDIFTTNRAAIVSGMNDFMEKMRALRDALAAGDDDAVRARLEESKRTRDQWMTSGAAPGRATDSPRSTVDAASRSTE